MSLGELEDFLAVAAEILLEDFFQAGLIGVVEEVGGCVGGERGGERWRLGFAVDGEEGGDAAVGRGQG